jgi:hypothetical protein
MEDSEEHVLPYAASGRARSCRSSVFFACLAFLSEALAFGYISLAYNGPLPMNWLLFGGLVVAGLALSAMGLAAGIRGIRRERRAEPTCALALAANLIALLLAIGYFGVMFVFEHF